MYNSYDLSLLFELLLVPMALFGIFLVFALLAFTIWMLIDCIRRDEKDFKERTLWIVLLIIGVLSGYSWILSPVYYFAIKRKLDR